MAYAPECECGAWISFDDRERRYEHETSSGENVRDGVIIHPGECPECGTQYKRYYEHDRVEKVGQSEAYD